MKTSFARGWKLMIFFCAVACAAHAQNHVLSLDVSGEYVRIESAPEFEGGENVVLTIEAWFMAKQTSFPVVGKNLNTADKEWGVFLGGGKIGFKSEIGDRSYSRSSPFALALNRWYHVAAVVNSPKQQLRVYLNGVLVIEDNEMPNPGPSSQAPVEIGANSYWPSYALGYIDEVRIWNNARTESEINETMFVALSGDEPGLVGYWRFEGKDDTVIDVTGNGHDGQFVDDATRIAGELPARDELLTRADFHQAYLESLKFELSVQREKSSTLTDVLKITAQRVPESTIFPLSSSPVEIEIQDEAGHTLATLQSETEKAVEYNVPDAVGGVLKISATYTDPLGKTQQATFTGPAHRSLEGLQLDVRRLKPDELKDALEITVHPVVPKDTVWTPPPLPVEIEIQDETGHTVATLQSETEKTIEWTVPEAVKGTLKILATYSDVHEETHQGEFSLKAHSTKPLTSQVGHWETIDMTDGLGGTDVTSIAQDRNGVIWFGLYEAGLCRYDGQQFRTFTTADGLPSNNVHTIFEDRNGVLWLGMKDLHSTASGWGVCRYDGIPVKTVTTR
ncbi:hypothetical protein IH992_21430, partial [Candidatus Poribacteria bacterium]|nr:hypothetical protein [Candidatus Poribacteria bacterium]